MGILAICSKSSRFFFPLHQVNFYLSLMSVLFAVSLTNNSVQFSHSVVSNSLQPHGLQHTRPLCPSLTPGVYSNSWSIESVMPSNNLILCRPLLLPPSIFPNIKGFPNESSRCIMGPEDWGFSISPSSDYSGLISFRMDWLYLLAVQGTLKNLLQHRSPKASVL